MVITISGRVGEGKTCVANIIRNALAGYGLDPDMGAVPFIDHEVAADLLSDRGRRSRSTAGPQIRICEKEET